MKITNVLALAIAVQAVLSMALLSGCVSKPKKITDTTLAVFETSQGTIEFEFMPDVAPKACENFYELIKKGYYDGVLFHRVIKGFMIQGGDPTGSGSGGASIWGGSFADELKPNVVFDRPGLLAMANHGANTNGSQFFISTAAKPELNGKYTIFGEVYSGLDVVRKIENTPTAAADRPVTEQKILKAYIREYKLGE